MSWDREIARKLLRRGLYRKLANYALAELQAWARAPYAFARPYWLTVDPTNFCQLRCPFCPTGSHRDVRPNAVMDAPLFTELMRELGPYLMHVDFMNWGEPLLNPKVFSMAALARSYGAETAISTNLNHLGPGMAGEIISCGLDRLVISIDGASQETYAKYRVGGDFARVMENLKAVLKARKDAGADHPRVIWQFLVFRHNEHELEKARAMAKDMGVDEIGFTAPCLPFRPGIKDEWMATDRKYCLYSPEDFPDSPPWEWAAAKDGEGKPKDVDVKVYSGTEKRSPCSWPWTGMTVNADGSVSPCCSVEERKYDFGTLTAGSFSKVWNNPLYRKARRHIREYAAGKKGSVPASDHACERCFSIGKADFQLPAWWRDAGADPKPDPLRTK